MRKQTITKIISGLILFVFVVSFFQFALPARAVVDVLNNNIVTNIGEFFKNPNQPIQADPYKFSLKVLKSGILQQVIGCTGVVNQVADWMSKLTVSNAKKKLLDAAKKKATKELLKAQCGSIKAGVTTAAGTTPTVNDLVSPIKTVFEKVNMKVDGESVKMCQDAIDAMDSDLLQQMKDTADAEAIKTTKEQCFDGIAITLAKNQLTSMTHSAMNWVNTGYGGNPFFVQNLSNFTNNIERNVLETGIDVLLAPNGNQSPYASDFAKSAIASRGIKDSSAGFLGNLQSTLGSFITDPQSYYTDENMSAAEKTQVALRRAQSANNAFANDFSVGGWDGWLALTQQDQNNPLGFTMLASQYLADEQAQKVSDAKAELAQNNGFLSQKTCIKWQEYDAKGNPISTQASFDEPVVLSYKTSKPATCSKPGGDCCVDWKIITPGSIIKDKVTNYLNSPERQLELVKTINDGINALFGVLISQLENAGLSGLSDSTTNPANWTDTMNNELASLDGNTPYNNNGAYDSFNLTSDLGNTYIHTTPTYLGTWNATTNVTIPIAVATPTDGSGNAIVTNDTNSPNYVGLYAAGVYDKDGKSMIPANSYYKVNIAGTTKLMLEGYNNWVFGDRAFWDGSAWQNWKCYTSTTTNAKKIGPCNNQINPIKKRGVIQIQQDYIVAAKEILGVLDRVMPKLGELDYCIPGPNPSYKTNSTDAQSAYQDWIGSLYIGPVADSGFSVMIDQVNTRTYRNLENIFTDNPGVWQTLKSSSGGITNIDWWLGHFNYSGKDYLSKTWFKIIDDINKALGIENYQTTIEDVQKIRDLNWDYVNNSLFQNFYEVFDKMMNKLYFSNMTSMYNETENKTLNIATDKNLGYIPMAQSGLDLTKNITYYNDDITKTINDYTDAIATAQVNIATLEPIKAEVSAIIVAAQGRRDANLLKILNAKDAKTVRLMDTNNNGTITADEYQKYYANCIAEENMNFFDANTIMETASSEAGRCSDGIDNDLDGLIDMKDPDCHLCARETTPDTVPGTEVDVRNNKACFDITNITECEKAIEYTDITNKSATATRYHCVWKQ